MIEPVSYPLKNLILGVVKQGRLRWLGPWLPNLTLLWQDLRREMHPLRIRWGWALVLAIILVLVMGECGPAASAIALLP